MSTSSTGSGDGLPKTVIEFEAAGFGADALLDATSFERNHLGRAARDWLEAFAAMSGGGSGPGDEVGADHR